jgi:hypothetical protein
LLPAGSGWFLSYATNLNGRGQIVGRGQHNGSQRMFRLEVGTGQIRDLGALPPPDDAPSLIRAPNDINQAGHVVGAS